MRPRVRGKFIWVGEEKLYVRGVTYGTFRPDESGNQYHDHEKVTRDFALMAANGINAVRVYNTRPVSSLNTAERSGSRGLLDFAAAQDGACRSGQKGAA